MVGDIAVSREDLTLLLELAVLVDDRDDAENDLLLRVAAKLGRSVPKAGREPIPEHLYFAPREPRPLLPWEVKEHTSKQRRSSP